MLVRYVKCFAPTGFYHMAYREWTGPVDAPTLVCVHGLTRNSRDFEAFAEAMRAHYRVIAPDLPGRGLSDRLPNPDDYAFPTYVTAMATLIARLDVESVDWLGTSMGALIGMLLAATPKQPIGRLVLNDAGPVVSRNFLLQMAARLGVAMRFDTLEGVVEAMRAAYGPQPDLSDEQWRQIAVNGARAEPDGRWRLDYDPHIGDVYRAGELADVTMWPIYDRVNCPTLMLRATESTVFSSGVAEEMTRRGPRAKLVEFRGHGHAPWLMNEGQISATRDFLLN